MAKRGAAVQLRSEPMVDELLASDAKKPKVTGAGSVGNVVVVLPSLGRSYSPKSGCGTSLVHHNGPIDRETSATRLRWPCHGDS